MRPSQFRTWLCAWIAIPEALVIILSFGYFYPSWVFGFLCWAEIRHIKKTKEVIGL